MRASFPIPIFVAIAAHLLSQVCSHDARHSVHKRSELAFTSRQCPKDIKANCVSVGLSCEQLDREPTCVDRNMKKCAAMVEFKCEKLQRECDERYGMVFCTDREHDECSKTMEKICLDAELDCVVIDDISYCGDKHSSICTNVTVKNCGVLGKKCETLNRTAVCTDRYSTECTKEAVQTCEDLLKRCGKRNKQSQDQDSYSTECSGENLKMCEVFIKRCEDIKNRTRECKEEECLKTCQDLYKKEFKSSQCWQNVCYCNGKRACTVRDCEEACRRAMPDAELEEVTCNGKNVCNCKFVKVTEKIIRYKCSTTKKA